MPNYLIIGNGVAGNSAAESIRRLDTQGNILIFSKEKHFFYYTPAFPEYLEGQKQIKDIIIHDEKWYAKHKIDLHLDEEIGEIDLSKKTALSTKGMSYVYAKLLLACGSNSFLPPIPGVSTAGVFTLRRLDDAERIRQAAKEARQAVIIGGGLLGLEAGNALRKMGLKVAVVEFFPRLLPRQLDITGAQILYEKMAQMGFQFYLGAKTQAIENSTSGLWVILERGEKIPTQLVLISAGVRPEVSLGKKLNLAINKGIIVDERLKTSWPDVYAAGDIAEYNGQVYGIWPAAMEQGKIAGLNMVGESAIYQGTVPANTLKVAGIDLLSAGDIDPEEKMEAIIYKDEQAKIYRRLVIQDNILIGAILLGDIRGAKEIQKAIALKRDVSLFKDKLKDLNFNFAALV
ncbi:MAG: NAD(P)/FAD-dependent oxidoreductase [Thermodesulfobacteriota bacterium]